MGYRLVNISELNTFDFSICTINGVQVCNIDNVRKGIDNFVIEGDEINDYSLEEIKVLMKSFEFNSLAKNLVVKSIFIDYNNTISSSIVFDSNTPFAENISPIDFIAELNSYKTVLEDLYDISINTITANFENSPSLTFNGSDTYLCSSLPVDLFSELAVVFQTIKQNIIDQLCA